MMRGQETVHGVETSPNKEIKKSKGEEKAGKRIVFLQRDTHIRLKSFLRNNEPENYSNLLL